MATFPVPDADWLLCEIPMTDMAKPIARFSAFVEAPWNALEGVTPDDYLPINGIAWSDSPADEYIAGPIIAFPPTDGVNVADIAENKKIFSLLVNVQAFPAGSTVRIGLYGYVGPFLQFGGIPGGTAELVQSDLVGSITYDYRDFAAGAWTPGGLQGAPLKYFWHSSYPMTTPEIYDAVVATFPEIADYTQVAHPILYGTDGYGDMLINGRFQSSGGGPTYPWQHADYATTWYDDFGSSPASATPNTDPNPWSWRTPIPAGTTWTGNVEQFAVGEYWGTDIFKKITNDYSMLLDSIDGIVVSVSSTEPSFRQVTWYDAYQVRYYVPTWKILQNRTAPVNISWVATGLPLWTQQARHYTDRPEESFTWETADYPTRPEFAEIGTATITALDTPLGDQSIPNHFGHIRIGTLVINRAAGTVEFTDAAEPITGGETGDGPDGDGTAPGRTANPQLRAWTYSLDGHDYYVLRLGDTLTLVYDDSSEQWMDWTDFSSLTWRAHCGINWTGAQNLAETYGSSILCGDDTFGLLWFLNPTQAYDDGPAIGDAPVYFSRVTVGQVPMKGREVLPCYAVWLTTDMGAPAYTGAGVTLYTSDDAGVTWDMHDFIAVTPGEASPELSWYSLGQIEAPGRLFKIFDNGAIARIDALEMNDPDDKVED